MSPWHTTTTAPSASRPCSSTPAPASGASRDCWAISPFRGTILLTHLHWDHVQGLPFFRSGDREDARVRMLLPDQGEGADAEAVLARMMSPPFFPIDAFGAPR